MRAARNTSLVGLWLLACPLCAPSPFNPHPPTKGASFFDGWYLRLVDHRQKLSLALIVGAIGSEGQSGEPLPSWTASLAVLLIASGGETRAEQLLGGWANLTVGSPPQPVRTEPAYSAPASFTFTSAAGSFSVRDGDATAELNFPSYRVRVITSGRVPWNPKWPDSDGPEGVLFPRARGTILPCHYFVHSLASGASYELVPARPGVSKPEPLVGDGFAHLETNYGSSFPGAWIWAQGVAPDGRSQFVSTITEIGLNGLATVQIFALAYRSPAFNLTLRSPDLAKMWLQRHACAGHVILDGADLLGHHRATLVINSSTAAGEARGFSTPLYAPTHRGFLRDPGCVESFWANAILRVHDPRGALVASDEFQLAALEFGGEWRCKLT